MNAIDTVVAWCVRAITWGCNAAAIFYAVVCLDRELLPRRTFLVHTNAYALCATNLVFGE